MDVKVTITETQAIERTYYVSDVKNLGEALECAKQCACYLPQPKAYLYQEVPYSPVQSLTKYEVVSLC